MSRGMKILLGLLFVFFLFLIFSNNSKEKKVNWHQTYVRKHKIPYGTYIFFNELSYFFPNSKIKIVNSPPYTFLKSNEQKGTYLLINKNISFGKEELEQMKEFVSRGNTVFISSGYFKFDSLGFSSSYTTETNFNASKYVKLTNKNFGEKLYTFNRKFAPISFDKIDTLNSTVLGEILYKDSLKILKKGMNFVKYKYGEGNFYFHTFPEAFTNYFVLDSINSEYTAGLMSYLDNPGTIYWDAYYKAGRKRISSPLHYIFNNESLKWAYYFLILGTLIFIIFKGKRKQKIIPVKKPEKNMSLEFAGTLTDLFLENSDHKKIAVMMINFFKENIRANYLLDTQVIDSKFVSDLAAKTNKTEEEISKTFKIFEEIQSKSVVTKEELTDLEKIIESFKNVSTRVDT